MSLRRFLQALMILSLLQGGPIWAATYWVSKAGSDSNACFASDNQPRLATRSRLTITAGAACLSSNDTLMVMPGNYNERLNNLLPNRATLRSADSNPANWFSVKPQNNVIPHQTAAIDHNQSRSNIIYKFFRVDLSDITSGNKPQACLRTGPTSITVEDFECIGPAPGMMSSTGSGIAVKTDTVNPVIRRGEISNIVSAESNPGAHGFYWQASNGIAEYVHIENVNGYCLQYWNGGSENAHSNIYRYNFCKDAGNGLYFGDGDGNLALNNIFWNTGGRIKLVSSGQKFFNNTIYGTDSNCIKIRGNSQTVQNNIVLNCGLSPAILNEGTDSTISNNLTSGDPGDIFTTLATGDFSLKAGSAAIDSGMTVSEVTTDFAGTPRPHGCCYDIGAFEYVSTVTTPPVAPGNLQVSSE